MKRYIFVCLFIGAFMCAYTQIVEKKVKDITYVIDSSKKEIKNKANKIPFGQGMPDSSCEHFSMENPPEELNEIYKQIFTEKRSNETKSSITIVGIFDKKGKAVEVYFKLYENFGKVTLYELYELEKAVKEACFKISSNCPDKQYYLFFMPCRFRNLYE